MVSYFNFFCNLLLREGAGGVQAERGKHLSIHIEMLKNIKGK